MQCSLLVFKIDNDTAVSCRYSTRLTIQFTRNTKKYYENMLHSLKYVFAFENFL